MEKVSWRSFTSGGDGSSRLSLMCHVIFTQDLRSKSTLYSRFQDKLESQRFASANRMNVMYCNCINVSQCITVPPRFKNESMYILLYYCITMHHAGTVHHATHPCHPSRIPSLRLPTAPLPPAEQPLPPSRRNLLVGPPASGSSGAP